MRRFDVMASEGTGEVLTGYKHYMIVHLQGDEADPVFDLIDAGEIAEAMQYLSQWDYGEYEEGTTAPPWGEMDIRYHMGEQVMYTNRGIGYAGLVYREKEDRKMKKDIIINAANRERIEAELSRVQERAKVRLISYDDIVRACAHIEDKLGITKKALEGTVVWVDLHAQDWPGAYKGIPESTQHQVQYRGGKWRLLHVDRWKCGRANAEFVVALSESAKRAILDRAERLL